MSIGSGVKSNCGRGGGVLGLIGDFGVCLSFCLRMRIIFLLGSRMRFLTGVRGCEGALGQTTGGGDI